MSEQWSYQVQQWKDGAWKNIGQPHATRTHGMFAAAKEKLDPDNEWDSPPAAKPPVDKPKAWRCLAVVKEQ
jgi:hypothetical protein